MKAFYVKSSLRPVLVDDDDFERINKYKWYLNGEGYIMCPNKFRLSRFILNVTDPKILVDHKNRDPFDNRKENLRICTQSQNEANMGPRSGKYKGISWNKRLNKWSAQISVSYKQKHLGLFFLEEEAAHAYDKAAKQHFGEYAYLNFPKEDE